jgi:hypothetical protein
MYQQLWGYTVEEKLYLRVREQKRLNTTGIECCFNNALGLLLLLLLQGKLESFLPSA